MALQHLRSNTASKRPTPGSMSDGQLAINTNATSPGLFFKDAGGALIKVGPVHVGTSAPNSVPAGSSGNAIGEQWLDTSGGGYVFKIWDGTAWRSETGQFVDVAGDTMTGNLTISGADLIMSNGEIVAETGSAATPSITFTGDTNTGLYSPGADQVALSTNGTGRLFVDANGRVGVGAAPVTYQLEVNGGTANTVAQFTSTDSVARVLFKDNAGEAMIGCVGDDAVVYTSTSANERLRITSAGNVGIGVTSQSTRLEVNGSIGIGRGAGGYTFRETPGGDEKASIKSSSTNELIFNVANAAEAARIDSLGRLLVGTSFSVGDNNNLQIVGSTADASAATFWRSSSDTGNPSINFVKTRGSVASPSIVSSGDVLGHIRFNGHDGVDHNSRAAEIKAEVDGTPGADDMPGRLVFSTTADGASSPTERMRITSSGRVLIDKTSSDFAVVGTELRDSGRIVITSDSGNNTLLCRLNNADGNAVEFFRDGTGVGSISLTTSATAYNTSSDYRLKENITPVTDGITRLQQLKPSRFNFIADPDKTVDGFLAHEVQTVVPEAITGEKDAVDDEGNPQYQGIDQSKLVPLLTAALQEAIGEIKSLKARVAALEAN